MKEHKIFNINTNKVVETFTGSMRPRELNADEAIFDASYTLPSGYTYNEFLMYKKNKKQIINTIKKLIVTVSSGKVFDGDEVSQNRMIRAISIAAITGDTTTKWKLADNTIVVVTLDELKEAVALAGKRMSEIWLA